MRRIGLAVAAIGLVAATSGAALAQPMYGPYSGYYYSPYYAAPAAVYPPAYYPYGYGYDYGWDGTHSSGTASRAYSYWGAQKSN